MQKDCFWHERSLLQTKEGLWRLDELVSHDGPFQQNLHRPVQVENHFSIESSVDRGYAISGQTTRHIFFKSGQDIEIGMHQQLLVRGEDDSLTWVEAGHIQPNMKVVQHIPKFVTYQEDTLIDSVGIDKQHMTPAVAAFVGVYHAVGLDSKASIMIPRNEDIDRELREFNMSLPRGTYRATKTNFLYDILRVGEWIDANGLGWNERVMGVPKAMRVGLSREAMIAYVNVLVEHSTVLPRVFAKEVAILGRMVGMPLEVYPTTFDNRARSLRLAPIRMEEEVKDEVVAVRPSTCPLIGLGVADYVCNNYVTRGSL